MAHEKTSYAARTVANACSATATLLVVRAAALAVGSDTSGGTTHPRRSVRARITGTEGHDSSGDLIGGLSFTPRNATQAHNIIVGKSERVERALQATMAS